MRAVGDGDQHHAATRSLALVLSAFFTSLAGGIHAYWITFSIPASAFDLTLNVRMVIMAVFGGPGTVFGPLLGAFILSTVYRLPGEQHLDRGGVCSSALVIVLAVIFMPRGSGRSGRRIAPHRPALFPAEHPGAPAMSAVPLFEAREIDQALSRSQSRSTMSASRPARRDPRADRPQRRRQDHAGQPDQRHARPRCAASLLFDGADRSIACRRSAAPGSASAAPSR